MNFSFTATIYKTGINPCVAVPSRITKKMTPVKGYILVKGTINEHSFVQTLVPVKDAGYRLYVNGIMLKGSRTKPGDRVRFRIEQDLVPRTAKQMEKPDEFKKQLKDSGLGPAFELLTPYRQKEILKYLNHLKSKEALIRNIEKVIRQLKNRAGK
jgi:hypothetical protein